mmetsp:Transcript_8874/g.25791  ORF Transcript_8874/g.25791 Transcript_8874/m.25791 type:complete len:247 (+) Transcript_8874:1479-2219(+)
MRPCRSRQSLVKSSKSFRRGWWMAQTMRRSLLCAEMRRRVTPRLSAVAASSPDVGSSRKSMLGFDTSSTAIAVRLRSPPETPRFSPPGLPTSVSAQRCRDSSAITSSTLASMASGGSDDGSRSSAAKRMVSRTVRCCSMISSWKTNAHCRRDTLSGARSFSKMCPLTSALPRTLTTRCASTCSSVVFPEPEGPMMAIISPPRTSPLTPLSTGFHAAGPAPQLLPSPPRPTTAQAPAFRGAGGSATR